MLGRYILIAIGTIAFLWTCFVAFDLIDKKNELSPDSIFGKEDQAMIIVHRPSEIDWSTLQSKTGYHPSTLISSLSIYPEGLKSIYISVKRDHILFESSNPWSKQSVKALLEQAGKVEFKGLQQVFLEDYSGKIYRNRLYLFKKELESTVIENTWIRHDKKASASLVDFSGETIAISDIYFKSNGTVEYISKSQKGIVGRQINDKELFSRALPKDISDYHFYEREYLSSKDAVFSESPMNAWIENGLVRFTFNGSDIIITDFKESQDPVNTLFDFTQNDPLNQSYGFFQNMELMKGFPAQTKKGFYAYNMDDFVVISSDQQACEKIVADFRLGNTLSQHPEKMNAIYGELPRKTSERWISENAHLTKSVYKSLLIETHFPKGNSKSDDIEKDPTDIQADSYKFGDAIFDFLVNEGKGSFIAITKNGIIRQYQNGKKAWERNIASEPIGKIQKVTFKGVDLFLITSKNGIHLFDNGGNTVPGFPLIVADKQLTAQATVYTWKNKSYILALNSNSELLFFDQTGKRIANIQTGLKDRISAPVVWVSQRNPYIGIRDKSTFKMFDGNTKREYRKFDIPAETEGIKKENELVQFCMNNGALEKIDQKGIRTKVQANLNGYTISSLEYNAGKTFITLSNDNSIRIIDENGKMVLNLLTDAQSIQSVSIFSPGSSKSLISVVDGLQNDVYLYGLNGEKKNAKPLEGELKSHLHSYSNLKILTSVVDDFIVQYVID